jgi:hypothetical protein
MFDWDDAEFKPLPEGTYTLVVHQAQIQDNRAGDGENINVELHVQSPDEYEGRRQFETMSLKTNALPYTKSKLEALSGQTLTGQMSREELYDFVKALEGERVDAAIVQVPHFDKQKADQGVVINNVDKFINPNATPAGQKVYGGVPPM